MIQRLPRRPTQHALATLDRIATAPWNNWYRLPSMRKRWREYNSGLNASGFLFSVRRRPVPPASAGMMGRNDFTEQKRCRLKPAVQLECGIDALLIPQSTHPRIGRSPGPGPIRAVGREKSAEPQTPSSASMGPGPPLRSVRGWGRTMGRRRRAARLILSSPVRREMNSARFPLWHLTLHKRNWNFE